jgi:hypothetical protein
MYVKHLGADMSLHRARKLISQVESAERDHLASDALRLESTEPADAMAGAPVVRVRVTEPPPGEVAVLGSEALAACRQALDDLAVSLVVASRRAPRSTTFPIAPDAHAYLEEERHCLRHANQEARRAVRSVTPWKGGDDVLWDLRQIAEAAGPVIGLDIGLGQVVELAPTRVPSVLGVLQPGFRTTRACLPLTDGCLLANPEAAIRLVLTYGEPARTRPLVPTMRMFAAHVTGVIERVVGATERHGSAGR